MAIKLEQRINDLYWLGIAEAISRKSKDPSTKVGAVILRPDNTVAGTGYNGFPKMMKDRSEDYENRDIKYSRIIHGEINAILHSYENLSGCSLYTWSLLPCDRCAVIVAQAGITRVVAPKLPDHLHERWGESVEKSKRIFNDCDVIVEEI